MTPVTPFPSRDVPLVGQPLEVLGWTLIVQVRCRCERTGVIALTVQQTPMGRSAAVGICPSCARAMHVQTISMRADGQLEFAIELGELSEPPRISAGTRES